MRSKRRPAGADRPLRRDAQRNRERILVAAREVFAERGVGATLDDVATRAGVGVGTVYRRFPNKDALLDELLEERVDELAELADGLLSEPDPWHALILFLERLEEASAANRALEDLVLDLADEHRHRHLAHARGRLLAPVAALVERAKAAGRLRRDFDARDIRMLHLMLASVVRETGESEPDLWRRYLAIVVDGLATARAEPTALPAPPPRID